MVAEEFYVDKLAYAQALFDGAGRISATAKDAPIGTIGIPFYLLIGFGIENALKAYIDYQKFPAGRWQRSHNLSALLTQARELGLLLPEGLPEFVDNLSLYHEKFWFRYPERAGVANVNSASTALYAADLLLRAVFDATGTAMKFR